MADYCIVIKSRAGTPLSVLTGEDGGFRQLSYQKELNAVGLLAFDLDGGHDVIDNLEQDGQVEVWRWDNANSIAQYADFEALFVDEERSADDDGNTLYRAICPGQMDFLAREVVAWPANVSNRSLFTNVKASTIMTNLVRYNAVAADATTGNGRIRTTDLANITYETDDDDGNVMTFACAQEPLLEAMRKVASIGDRDFWLERTGAQAWTLRTDNYFGLDRSDSVVFALNYGNMSRPILRRNRLNEKTVAIVGGQGVDSSRSFEVRTGANYNATYNSKVIFYAATQYTTEAGLESAGDARLEELRAKDDLSWIVIQTPGSMYGVHYGHGDIVTGYFDGVTASKQIVMVRVTYAPSGEMPEDIQIETATI